MDYQHDIEFGYFLVPDAGDPRGWWRRLASQIGSATTCSPSRTIPISAGIWTPWRCSA